MHRFPKLLSRSSGRSKSRADASSSRQAPKPKRLDRSYALKNIDYEFSPPASATSSSYSHEESLRTRSLGLYGGTKSFRIDGTEGEIEIICETFGFSGIDDFAISPEEYETMKARSSSSAPVVFTQELEPVICQKTVVDSGDIVDLSDVRGGIGVIDLIKPEMEGTDICTGYSDNGIDVVSTKLEGGRDFGCIDRCMDNTFSTGVIELSKRLGDDLRINDVNSNHKVIGRSKLFRGNGIKGVRPTIIVPMPASRGFSGFQSGFCLDGDKEGAEQFVRDKNEQEKDMGITVTTREQNRVLLELPSFSSSDDDSSSTVTEPMSSISSNERDACIIEDWQKGELLGSGSFGTVYEGIADYGFFFAVKEVSLLGQGNEAKQCIIQLEQEIALLSQFEHENIVRYYGTKKDESHLYIFLELVTKGSLLSLYQKYELRCPIAAAYTRQILHGLKYLHDKNVIHRDIKCANILVHSNGLVKLADFGLAKAAKLNDKNSCKGTAYWMAPEVVRCQGYGLEADIWSLGCTVLEMLTRRFPYSDLEYMSALYRIGQGERPQIPETLPSDARDFIHRCLQTDPRLRPKAAQLLDHPFVKRPLSSSSSTDSPRSFTRQI